jgi:cardiolipin synthase
VFVEKYLEEVRRERFRPRALAAYVLRVGRDVRADILANPTATRSIWIVALGFFAAAFAGSLLLAVNSERHLAEELFLYTSLTALVTFALVTLNVGVLRDRSGYALSGLSVPCVLTLARVALLPGFVLFLLDRRLGLALVTFSVAALTDVADGWVARRFRQETRLGTVMDPIVDIVFNFTVFGAVAAAGVLPAWIFAVAAVRYGLLLCGGAYLYLFHGPVRIAPTWFGRLSGAVMSVLVGLLLAVVMAGGRVAERVAPLTCTALGILLSMAVAQVLVMGWYNLRLFTGEARAARRVINDVHWGAS